jgi:hypothetical protein
VGWGEKKWGERRCSERACKRIECDVIRQDSDTGYYSASFGYDIVG